MRAPLSLGCLLVSLLPLAASAGSSPAPDRPSRPAYDKCKWERLSDERAGLAAWVQRCDYGFRKVDLHFQGSALALRFSDGGNPDPVVEVFTLRDGEAIEAGLRRLFDEKTEKALARRCRLAKVGGKGIPAGVKRYAFRPDAAYAKELAAKANPDEVGDPPCGALGESPDGVQYFEAQPARNPHRVLFVRVGQEAPLFDEKTLRLLPGK